MAISERTLRFFFEPPEPVMSSVELVEVEAGTLLVVGVANDGEVVDCRVDGHGGAEDCMVRWTACEVVCGDANLEANGDVVKVEGWVEKAVATLRDELMIEDLETV